MKVATAAYPLDFFESWAGYEDKIFRWVDEAASHGADLLVFPEYAAMELSSLAGADVAKEVETSFHAVSDRMAESNALHAHLASQFDVHILSGSGPVFDKGDRPVNRAHFFAPNGKMEHQDKQILTRCERTPWDMVPGGPLKVFETSLGKIGVLICYDSEFPLLGRALSECDVILVPSCTEALSGYWRVRIGAMSRAMEAQCVTVMASLVGPAEWSEAVDINTGMGGVFGPPDIGFPETGVLAEGALNQPGWTYADVDLDAVAHVRADGGVLHRSHWPEQSPRDSEVTYLSMK
ncbi:carbon-nitrogen hydrolase family protein [Shimia thalassica]|uniref:carbon-nitrogen hydrolase family protein n=1 Tax=Shimia thalassica TaxID=1715693 RepID=UPI0026E1DFB3|nr:carbon-nitrogen hydrolase family protein [Shimia thalassica]MDO6484023.1 carbon-nitrogen hydrolase family protein [Shimia thalassica]MDP2518329.1 carbon-nitrogen hydrolase family protein [Shimia thalassica]